MSVPASRKTMEELREELFSELYALRTGKTTPNQARAVARLASTLIDSIRVQIQYQRLLEQVSRPMRIGKQSDEKNALEVPRTKNH
jgi:hypothetical protein